ncbi:MAG: cytochrome c [Flavobacteriales bacterium]
MRDPQRPKRSRNPPRGKSIFNSQCAMCHGRAGDLGLNGAKDLTTSALPADEVTAVVTNGRGAMMAYGKILDPGQVKDVVEHVLTLRKKG